jgi:hypothetical protein
MKKPGKKPRVARDQYEQKSVPALSEMSARVLRILWDNPTRVFSEGEINALLLDRGAQTHPSLKAVRILSENLRKHF